MKQGIGKEGIVIRMIHDEVFRAWQAQAYELIFIYYYWQQERSGKAAQKI